MTLPQNGLSDCVHSAKLIFLDASNDGSPGLSAAPSGCGTAAMKHLRSHGRLRLAVAIPRSSIDAAAFGFHELLPVTSDSMRNSS